MGWLMGLIHRDLFANNRSRCSVIQNSTHGETNGTVIIDTGTSNDTFTGGISGNVTNCTDS